jgi:hypothetical protein
MATCGNDKLLFMHVPKTGGTWAVEAMTAAGIELAPEKDYPHPTLSELDRRGRFTFAFVREPLSWYGSWWSHRRKTNKHTEGDFMDEWIHSLDFPDFLKRVAEYPRVPGHPVYLARYYEQFVGPPEDPIDFIGRYESLVDDLVTALELAGQAFNEASIRATPAINVSDSPKGIPPSIWSDFMLAEAETYDRFYPGFLDAMASGLA